MIALAGTPAVASASAASGDQAEVVHGNSAPPMDGFIGATGSLPPAAAKTPFCLLLERPMFVPLKKADSWSSAVNSEHRTSTTTFDGSSCPPILS